MDDERKRPEEPPEPMRVPRGTDDLPIPEQGYQKGDVPKRLPDEY